MSKNVVIKVKEQKVKERGKKDKEKIKLYNLPRLNECLKRKLRKNIKLISMMHGLILLLGLMVKDSIIILKHNFEHDAPGNSKKDSNANPKVKITKEKIIG